MGNQNIHDASSSQLRRNNIQCSVTSCECTASRLPPLLPLTAKPWLRRCRTKRWCRAGACPEQPASLLRLAKERRRGLLSEGRSRPKRTRCRFAECGRLAERACSRRVGPERTEPSVGGWLPKATGLRTEHGERTRKRLRSNKGTTGFTSPRPSSWTF